MSNDAVTAAELAQLEAAAAEAAAEAAAAKARAAAAALAAAQAAAGVVPTTAPDPVATDPVPAAQPEVAPADEPSPAVESESNSNPEAELSAADAGILAGYSFSSDVLPIGGLLNAEGPVPAVQIGLPLKMVNRHGLVAGATGTGKTKSLQVLTEGLSRAGVPVLVADIKGDLSGLAEPGPASEGLSKRTASIAQDWQSRSFPVEFYALGGVGQGIPLRTTVTDFGPMLLSKVLGLNRTQESSLTLVFHWADTQGLALLDLKDLQATIAFLVSDEGKEELRGIGGLSAATAGVILREVVALQAQGADAFFGQPEFQVSDLLRTANHNGETYGIINAIELPDLTDRPAIFSTFLMWLLAELFEVLPEVGDLDKPKLVFFFDEAHLLFSGASKAFLTQVVQTVRLIRSKGVGVFFVTQSPKDVPNDVLAQLGSRVQHALRAHTADDATALRAAVRTYPKSAYDLEKLLTELKTGEAVVTVQSESGSPTPVAWTRMRAPESSMDPASPVTMQSTILGSLLHSKYANAVDNESAYEILTAQAQDRAEQVAADAEAEAEAKQALAEAKEAERKAAAAKKEAEAAAKRRKQTASKTGNAAVTSLMRSVGTQLGREITRGLFGTRRS